MSRARHSFATRWSLLAASLGMTALALSLLSAQQTGKEDQEKIQGSWKVTSGEMDGNAMPAALAERHRFHFVGDKLLVMAGDQGTMLAEFKLNAHSTPKAIDMVLEDQDKQRCQGIYGLYGDKLRICFVDPVDQRQRPAKFATEQGSGCVLFNLERIKPAPGEKSGEDLLKEHREAAPRRLSAANLRQLGIAMHNYHNDFLNLPMPAIYSKEGKPLLSWRVAVLPYVEEHQLYKQFKLDEPWDSDANKPLLARMPKIYAPVQGQAKEPHATYYRVFASSAAAKPGAMFINNGKLTLGQLMTDQDGTSNTVMIVEAGDAVPWTKPDELVYDPNKPIPKLGGLFAEGFHACFANCSTHFFKKDVYGDEPVLRAIITRNGGEDIDFKRYWK